MKILLQTVSEAMESISSNSRTIGSVVISKSFFIAAAASVIVGVSVGYIPNIRNKFCFNKKHRLKTSSKSKNDIDLVDPDFCLTEANFKYTFHDVKNMRKSGEDVFSPPIWIGELPWQIMLRPTKLCLESHVVCSELYCSWSCCIHLEFSLLGRTPRVLAVDDELYEADSQTEYNRNLGQNIPWEEILDPGNGYLHKDSITFLVNLKVEILERISWTDRMYLKDERANSLVKKYKTDLDILRTRIRQLKDMNQDLSDELKLMKIYRNSNFL